jgi:hypothetical protein
MAMQEMTYGLSKGIRVMNYALTAGGLGERASFRLYQRGQQGWC